MESQLRLSALLKRPHMVKGPAYSHNLARLLSAIAP